MALQGREIKNRLRSIKNSKKITKAMELVSAAKMRKAVQAAVNTRTYANMIWDIMFRIVTTVELKPTDQVRRFFSADHIPADKPEHITIVLFTSNRGLCGAFNTNVIRKTLKLIKDHGKDNVTVVAFGKKGVTALNNLGIKAELAYAKDDVAKDTGSITEAVEYVYEQYRAGKTDRVMVGYTDYHSAVVQVAVLKQLFPLDRSGSITKGVENDDVKKPTLPDTAAPVDYLYEPDQLEVLSYLVPRLTEVQLYQALLESNAAEHSARMVAMKSATDAAGDMIDDLVLAFNRTRQASITKEIAEISAGTAAVS